MEGKKEMGLAVANIANSKVGNRQLIGNGQVAKIGKGEFFIIPCLAIS
ncbi:MAG: hypothetical protein WAV32_01730 [Halobacteriota archaeon]